jgi:hypothetical protein
MSTSLPLFWPALTMVLLTNVVLVLMGIRRKRSLEESRKTIADPEVAAGTNRWNNEANKAARNYDNLLELPVLFYTVVVFATLAGAADAAMIWLAWGFVALRVVHTLEHVGPNRIPIRAGVFLASAIVLGVMWLRVAWRLATTG